MLAVVSHLSCAYVTQKQIKLAYKSRPPRIEIHFIKPDLLFIHLFTFNLFD